MSAPEVRAVITRHGRHVGLFTPDTVALAYATVDYYEWIGL